MSEAHQAVIEQILAAHFGANKQPDMSGDQRNRLLPHMRRAVEDCAREILRAPDPRIAAAKALAEAVGEFLDGHGKPKRSDYLPGDVGAASYERAVQSWDWMKDARAALLKALEAGDA